MKERRRAELVLNRLGLGVLTLFAASVLIFVGHGDPAGRPRLGDPAEFSATPEALAKMRTTSGSIVRLGCATLSGWSTRCAATLAVPLRTGATCFRNIAPRLANTMFLASYAALVAVPLAMALGLAGGDLAGRGL